MSRTKIGKMRYSQTLEVPPPLWKQEGWLTYLDCVLSTIFNNPMPYKLMCRPKSEGSQRGFFYLVNNGPMSWAHMRKPVCRLNVALYGHPDSGTDWESHCDQSLQKVGFQNVGGGAWPSCYAHKELGLLISVYVDDFKLAGPKANLEQGWKLITKFLELDPPQPLNLYL